MGRGSPIPTACSAPVLVLCLIFFSSSASGGPAPEPFRPPSLKDLEKVKWVPQPVVDALEIFREHKGKQPPPVPDEEALALRNKGPEENGKIAAALGRLPRSGEEVDWEATLVLSINFEPKTLNILLNSTISETYINNNIYAGPFILHWDMFNLADREVVESWATSEDGLMDRVVLRKDLTWTDGAPFDARDIEFSYHAIMDYEVPSPSLHIHTDELKGVKAYDEWTVVYFHKEPLATNVGHCNFQIVPRHIFERTLKADPTMVKSEEHNRLNRSPVTNGPYRLASWKAGEEIVLERRPEWYEKDGMRIRAKPYIKTIRFRIIPKNDAALLAFRKGEIDVLEITSPDLWLDQTTSERFYERGTKVAGEEWSMYMIGWNQRPIPDVPFFKDRRVREALSRAFAHDELLTDILSRIYAPARGIFHPDSWVGDPSIQPLHQDPSRAARLLSEAGWEDTDRDGILEKDVDGKRVPFRFTLTIGAGSFIYPKIASLLQRDLKRLGIACDVKEIEFRTLETLAREHKLQAFTMGWMAGADPDMARNMWTTEAYENGRNYVGYSNPKVDELFARGQRELDRKKRAEIYREINRTVTGEYPITVLCHRASLYAVSKSIRGFNFSPRGPFNFSPGTLSIWKRKI